MRKIRAAAIQAIVLITAIASNASAQTLTNPDISAIGDMRYNFRPKETADGLGVNTTEFEFRELELALAAYLNPYMRGDVYIGIHGTGEAPEIEEASMTVLRGLPLSLQLKGGKYLLDFGRVNQMHPHQFAWLEFPLMTRAMLGEEGLRTVGARLFTLMAIGDNAVTVAADAFSADAFAHTHGDEAHAAEETAPAEIMGSGRISWFRQFSDAWTGDAGVSGLYGTFDANENLKKRIAGADLKLRWRPDQYRLFVWLAEFMFSDSDAEPADSLATVQRIPASGAFTAVDYQFRRRWDVGGFFDWTEDTMIEGAQTTAAGAFFGFMPVEETARFSVVYRHETSDLYEFTNHTVTVQMLWSLGPHKPHTY